MRQNYKKKSVTKYLLSLKMINCILVRIIVMIFLQKFKRKYIFKQQIVKKNYSNEVLYWQEIIVKNDLKSLNNLLKNENIGAIQTLICEDDKVKIYNFAFNYNEIQLSKYEKEKKKIVNKAIRKIVCENLLNEHMDCLHELEKSLSQQTKDNFKKLADAIEKHFNLKQFFTNGFSKQNLFALILQTL